MTQQQPIDFQVFSSALEPLAKEGHPLFPGLSSTDDMPVLPVVSSSTEQDLYEDTMSMMALQDMCETPVGQSIFRNHSYDLPNDFFGKSVVRPVIIADNKVADLHEAFGVYIADDNNKKTYDQIKSFNARHGVSVGVMVLEYHFDGDPDDWFAPIIIDHVLRVETSVVGIPASQRSWVENAISGVFLRHIRDDNGEEALRLAPAYKGLFGNDYKELVKSLRSEGLRKELEKSPIRSSNQKVRLGWEPVKKHFVFRQGNREQVVERSTIPALLKQYSLRPALTPIPIEPEDTKAVSGKTSLPLMSLATEWDGSRAKKDIFDYARDENGDIVASKAKQGFLYNDPANLDVQSGYKMPFCFKDGDGLKIVPEGVRTIAGVLSGSMGGIDASEDDKNSMKAKVQTMYARINKELKPDPEWVVPWEKEEKSMSATDGLTTKEATKDAATMTDIEIKEGGTHAAFTGTHSHAHTSMGSQGGDETHEHEHSHDGDANHGHSHSDTTKASSSEKSSEPSEEQEEQEQEEQQKSAPTPVTPELTPIQAYQLAQLNTLGVQIVGSDRWVSLGINDLLTIKEGKKHSAETVASLKQVHDIVAGMGGSMVCGLSSDNPDPDTTDPDSDSDDDTTKAYIKSIATVVEEQHSMLEEQRALIVEQQKSIASLVEALHSTKAIDASVTKAIDSVALLTKELETIHLKHKKAVTQVNALADSIDALKSMPLGDPRNLQRSVTMSGEGVVSARDFLAINNERETLEDALARTTTKVKELANGSRMIVRVWPEGVGKGVSDEVEGGVRPELGIIQRKNMDFKAWYAYKAGGYAEVPVVPGEDAADVLKALARV